jgi:hypothetical protein
MSGLPRLAHLECEHCLLVGAVESQAQHHALAVQLTRRAVKEVVLLNSRRSAAAQEVVQTVPV